MPLPAADLCTVTGTFFDASGVEKRGVLVRFTPMSIPERMRNQGFIVAEITAESDEDGLVTLNLVRGAKGVISITGISLFREVEVPDLSACDIFELVGTAPDPFEPNEEEFIDLPRTS